MGLKVELWRRRRRVGWMALVWLEGELRQVLFYGGDEMDAWWGAQVWVAEHG